MKFKNIENLEKEIQEFTRGKYEICTNLMEMDEFQNKIINMEMLRIKRINSCNTKAKTLLFADVSKIGSENDLKNELKKIMVSTAMVKESLHDTENVDLYLFLALPEEISQDECVRIESTEQLCRKYVLMPKEELSDFFERTFLSKIVHEEENIDGLEPIAQAFAKVEKKHVWMSEKVQNEWRGFFLEYSGTELAEKLIGKEIS